jgi:hypothetical protein
LFRPPVAQVPGGIELTTLIVEPVCHFVSNDRADSTVIDAIIRVCIKKWRLQNSRWEHDFVHVWVVICVDRRRRHAPFGGINQLADLVQIAGCFELCRTDRIQDEWPAINRQ